MGSQSSGVALRRSPWLRVKRPATGTVRKQHEQPARDGQILLEMQELVAAAQARVEKNSGRYAEPGEEERRSARLIADEDE